jgi:hypothetical protein
VGREGWLRQAQLAGGRGFRCRCAGDRGALCACRGGADRCLCRTCSALSAMVKKPFHTLLRISVLKSLCDRMSCRAVRQHGMGQAREAPRPGRGAGLQLVFGARQCVSEPNCGLPASRRRSPRCRRTCNGTAGRCLQQYTSTQGTRETDRVTPSPCAGNSLASAAEAAMRHTRVLWMRPLSTPRTLIGHARAQQLHARQAVARQALPRPQAKNTDTQR